MISINDYLDEIFYDFVAYLDEGHELCDLKSVNFDQGRVPDYEDIHVQQYYLLRYAYAYAFEYKRMYETLFERFIPHGSLDVTSIGCGTMIDYWALARVLKQGPYPNVSVNYMGIDLIDWYYQIPERKKDTVTFCQNDVLDEFIQYESLNSDIYFFPKSISEFSDDEYEELCKIFEETPISVDQLHILISVRSDQGSLKRDLQRAEQLRGAIVKNGFVTDDHCRRFWTVDNEDEKIRSADSDFSHPADIVDTLKELNIRCIHYQEHHTNCSKDCINRLNRWPILKQNQVRFLILSFERVL